MALTADGSAAGYVTVDSALVLYPGTRGWLGSSTESSIEVVIVKAGTTAGVFYVRQVPTPVEGKPTPISYGVTDVSRFHLGDTATLSIPQQIVNVNHLFRGLPTGV